MRDRHDSADLYPYPDIVITEANHSHDLAGPAGVDSAGVDSATYFGSGFSAYLGSGIAARFGSGIAARFGSGIAAGVAGIVRVDAIVGLDNPDRVAKQQRHIIGGAHGGSRSGRRGGECPDSGRGVLRARTHTSQVVRERRRLRGKRKRQAWRNSELRHLAVVFGR